MATARARATQKAEATASLVSAISRLADALGIDAPVIPMHHKDAAYLPTVQLEVVAAFLNDVAAKIAPEPKAAAKTAKPKADA